MVTFLKLLFISVLFRSLLGQGSQINSEENVVSNSEENTETQINCTPSGKNVNSCQNNGSECQYTCNTGYTSPNGQLTTTDCSSDSICRSYCEIEANKAIFSGLTKYYYKTGYCYYIQGYYKYVIQYNRYGTNLCNYRLNSFTNARPDEVFTFSNYYIRIVSSVPASCIDGYALSDNINKNSKVLNCVNKKLETISCRIVCNRVIAPSTAHWSYNPSTPTKILSGQQLNAVCNSGFYASKSSSDKNISFTCQTTGRLIPDPSTKTCVRIVCLISSNRVGQQNIDFTGGKTYSANYPNFFTNVNCITNYVANERASCGLNELILEKLCIKLTCPIGSVRNGRYTNRCLTDSSRFIKTKCDFTCNRGYVLSNGKERYKIKCNDKLTRDIEPNCQKYQCDPPTINVKRIQLNDNIKSKIIKYPISCMTMQNKIDGSCSFLVENGYTADTNYALCTSTTTVNPSTITVTGYTCYKATIADNTLNITLQNVVMDINNVVGFYDIIPDNGYKVNNQLSIRVVCQSNGTPIPSLVRVRPITCNQPTHDSNTVLVSNNCLSGTYISISCSYRAKRGYKLNKSGNVRCKGAGPVPSNLSSTALTCSLPRLSDDVKIKIKSRSELPPVDFTMMSGCILYETENGYTINGNQTIYACCMEQGRNIVTSPSNILLAPIRCSEPQYEKMKITVSNCLISGQINGVCDYSINRGYEFTNLLDNTISSVRVHCTFATSPVPNLAALTAIALACDKPQINPDTLKLHVNFGNCITNSGGQILAKCIVTAEKGYSINRQNEVEVVCQRRDTTTIISSVRVIRVRKRICNKVKPDTGYFAPECFDKVLGVIYGEGCLYTCHPGHKIHNLLSNSQMVHCSLSGIADTIPSCVGITCPRPTLPSSSNVVLNCGSSIKTFCRSTCANGYYFKSRTTSIMLYCTISGTEFVLSEYTVCYKDNTMIIIISVCCVSLLLIAFTLICLCKYMQLFCFKKEFFNEMRTTVALTEEKSENFDVFVMDDK